MAFKNDNPGFTKIRSNVCAWYRHGEFPDKRVRDAENYSKALSDMLVGEGVLEDDSLIRLIIGEWADDVEPGMTEVVIAPLRRVLIQLLDRDPISDFH